MQGADWLPICYSVSGLNIFLTERLVNENRILVIQPVSFKLQQMKLRLSIAAGHQLTVHGNWELLCTRKGSEESAIIYWLKMLF